MERAASRWQRRSAWVAGLALIVLSLAATGVYITGELIGSGVLEAVDIASAEHSGDRVEALMAYVESDRHPLRLRNRAVWALGQIGDPRALPMLEKHYTGGQCDHALFLCQYELDKAIRLCRGSRNITAFVWR